MNKKLIFLHIPKAGGLTMRSIIERNFPAHLIHHVDGSPGSAERFARLPEEERRAVKVLRGHMPFGLHKDMCAPADYITLLRHPVERIISLYHYIRMIPENQFYTEVVGRRMSLDDFAAGSISQVINHQTRLISGREDDFTVAALRTAKENLSRHFTVAGLNERFDESLVLFKRRVGLGNIYYVKQNVTKNRPPRREVPRSTVRLIEKRNELDLDLYEFAAREFEELVAAEGAGFAEQVNAFRRGNKIYGGLARSYEAARSMFTPAARTTIKRVWRKA